MNNRKKQSNVGGRGTLYRGHDVSAVTWSWRGFEKSIHSRKSTCKGCVAERESMVHSRNCEEVSVVKHKATRERAAIVEHVLQWGHVKGRGKS